jgi:hypothetical protein
MLPPLAKKAPHEHRRVGLLLISELRRLYQALVNYPLHYAVADFTWVNASDTSFKSGTTGIS